MGEQTKSKYKEEFMNDGNSYLNRVSLKKSNDNIMLMPDELLPKSSNNIFTNNFPVVETAKIYDRLPTLDEKKPEIQIERPDFSKPIKETKINLNGSSEYEINKQSLLENMFSVSTKIEKVPKSILKKPIEKSDLVEVNNRVEEKRQEIDISKIYEILRKYNISVSIGIIEERIKRLNIDSKGKVNLLINDIVREFKPRKLERQIEPIKVFNERDYYRETIRICVNSGERDIEKYVEPNSFEINLPNNGLNNVCSVRLISIIMPKKIEEDLDNIPFMILDIRELGQNFLMNNGRLGGFCQVIFEKENANFKMAFPDISMASKELKPVRNISKLTIRLLKSNGDLIKFGNKLNDNIELEIETKPKIILPEYNPDPNIEIKKIEESSSKEDNEIRPTSDNFPPVSLLFEFTYLKNRSLMT